MVYIDNMKKIIFILILMIGVCALLFAQADRNARFVAVQSTHLKSSTGFFASNVAALSLGDEVTLISDNGRWSNVRRGTVTGWIPSNELSTRRVVSAGGTGASASEVALAGKGFSPQTEMDERARTGLDFSVVDQMEQTSVSLDELLLFITEGGLRQGE